MVHGLPEKPCSTTNQCRKSVLLECGNTASRPIQTRFMKSSHGGATRKNVQIGWLSTIRILGTLYSRSWAHNLSAREWV
jgi:hypothetical protein